MIDDGWMDEKGGVFLIIECLTDKCERNGRGGGRKWAFCNCHSEDCFGLLSLMFAKSKGKFWWAGYLHGFKVSLHRLLDTR